MTGIVTISHDLVVFGGIFVVHAVPDPVAQTFLVLQLAFLENLESIANMRYAYPVEDTGGGF